MPFDLDFDGLFVHCESTENVNNLSKPTHYVIFMISLIL